MKTCWSMRFDCLVTLSDLVFHRILAGARACPPLARPAGSCAVRASPSPSLVLFILKIVLLVVHALLLFILKVNTGTGIYFKSKYR